MDWIWRLIQRWRARGQGTVQRIILLEFAGLEPVAVERFLEQGLFHYLALLSDVGTRTAFLASRPRLVRASVGIAARRLGARCKELLPSEESTRADLAAICLADRRQQEQLIAELSRSRRGLVVCIFDMPSRLSQLYGPQPDEAQQHVLRDVYARMDEIVGKAYSFVDEYTELFVICGANGRGGGNDAQAPELLFSSCKLEIAEIAEVDLSAVVLGRLGRPSGQA